MEDPWRMTGQTAGLYVFADGVFAEVCQYQPFPVSLPTERHIFFLAFKKLSIFAASFPPKPKRAVLTNKQ